MTRTDTTESAHRKISALDVNTFRAGGDRNELDSRTRDLIARRRAALGPAYRLFYREPLELVRGEGSYLYDAAGKRYLDMYNNVSSVGHANPRVTAAVHAQMQTLNTHTRYLHEGIVGYAEDLLSTFPDALDTAMFTCTGSEANDLALRVVKHATGKRGIVVTRNAYHGGTVESAMCSPSMGHSDTLDSSWVRYVDAPATLDGRGDPGVVMAAGMREAIADLERSGHGFAGFLADTIFSTDGIVADPVPFLKPVIDVVHEAGGLFIADEVQPGFGRLGDGLWGYRRHGVDADIVTMGKPMGNGFPVAGTVIDSRLLEGFGDDLLYFNTFGGNPVAMAAASAVLGEIRDRGLVENSRAQGTRLLEGLRRIAAEHDGIAEARGAGLFTAIEFRDRTDGTIPDAARASEVVNALRDRGVLISTTGSYGNSLKIRPPLVAEEPEIDLFLELLDATLTESPR